MRNELERCLLECVVPEAEGKGAPKVGPRAVAELLNCVRERMGRKAVYCVNWQMLPQASAATKIYAELSKGRVVAVGFAEGYSCGQPFVEAKTLEELVENSCLFVYSDFDGCVRDAENVLATAVFPAPWGRTEVQRQRAQSRQSAQRL